MRRFLCGVMLSCVVALPAIAQTEGWQGKAEPPQYQGQVFPPWQHGENNDAVKRGFEFTVPEADALADFHGDVSNPKRVLYVGGN